MTTPAPVTIGGRFTNTYPWISQPAISTQDGGRRRRTGWVGSGSGANPGSVANNSSSSGITGTWDSIWRSQGMNENTWSSYLPTANPPWYWYKADYSTGSLEPYPGPSGFFPGTPFGSIPPYGSQSAAPGYFSYQDNPFAGAASGPDGTALRDPGNWIATITQPPSAVDPATGLHRITDTTSVKTSVCNQYIITPGSGPGGKAISGFNSITGYRNQVNPTSASLVYDASWDIYGWAHSADTQYAISLEVMFWTYFQGGQNPWNIQSRTSSPYETGLAFGDGNTWDLYMSDDTAATGGVTNSYSYAIFCLHDVSPNAGTDKGWADLLSPLRYFVEHYVVTSNGAPANPLDVKIWAIIQGWEMCSSSYAPAQFTHLDARLELTLCPPPRLTSTSGLRAVSTRVARPRSPPRPSAAAVSPSAPRSRAGRTWSTPPGRVT